MMPPREPITIATGLTGCPKPQLQADSGFPPIARRYLSGSTFHAELKGRIEISAMEAKGWIILHTEAGPIMLKDQIIDCDSGEL